MPLIVCDPTVVVVIGDGQVATPDKVSEHVNVTVALCPKMIPLAFGAGETEALIVGGVSSIFSVMEVLAVFLAASVTVPEIDWFAPSVLTTCWGEQLVIGAAAGVHWKLTVTVLLFHPAALAGGAADAVMLGWLVSRLIVTVAVAVFPGTSVAVPETA